MVASAAWWAPESNSSSANLLENSVGRVTEYNTFAEIRHTVRLQRLLASWLPRHPGGEHSYKRLSMQKKDKSRITYHWHTPRSVQEHTLHHDGIERQPGDPLIPCIKLRGMWMARAGIEPGTRVKVEAGPCYIMLSTREPTVAVTYRREGQAPSGSMTTAVR